MAEIIDLNIRMGENVLFAYPLPCSLYTRTPYITWTLPLERVEEEVEVTNSYRYDSSNGWVNTSSGGEALITPTDRTFVVYGLNYLYNSSVGWYHSAENDISGISDGVACSFNGENWVLTGSSDVIGTDKEVVVTLSELVFTYKYYSGIGWATKLEPRQNDEGTVTYTKIEVTYKRIEQARFNCRITAIDSSARFINGAMTSPNTYFQWPSSNPMTNNFIGLCSIEVSISSNDSGDFEYTSGVHYFVFDENTEIVPRRGSFVVNWSNSTDVEQTWNEIKYHLIVATDPTFKTNSVMFDDLVPSVNSISTYKSVQITKESDFYFYKVRAFDGFDYSAFTPVNAFMMTDNRGPSITIHGVTVTNNEDRDVVIDFSVEDPDNDIMSVSVRYFGGIGEGASENGAYAFMANPLVALNNGRMQAIWRSSIDEKRIESDYYIYMVVTDLYGMSADATSLTFHLDNSDIGVSPSKPNNLSYDFACRGRIINKIIHNANPELFRNIGYFANPHLPFKSIIPRYKGYNSTWSTYIAGLLQPEEAYSTQIDKEIYVGPIDFNDVRICSVGNVPSNVSKDDCIIIEESSDSESGFVLSNLRLNTKIDNFFQYAIEIYDRNNGRFLKSIVLEKYDYYNKIGRLRESIINYDAPTVDHRHPYRFNIKGTCAVTYRDNNIYSLFSYPLGMQLPRGGIDLDQNDCSFAVDVDYVNSEGYYRPIEPTPQWSYSDLERFRKGYIRLKKQINAYSKDKCDKCGGKGWREEDLIEDTSIASPYRFKRVPCPYCKGHRFYHHEETGEQGQDNTEPRRFEAFYVSDYRPIKGYIAPLDFYNGLFPVRYIGITRNAPKYVDYIIGEAVDKGGEYSKHQMVAKTMYNPYYSTNGFFDGFGFKGFYGNKKSNRLPNVLFRYIGKMAKSPIEQKYFNRYLGNIFKGTKDYIPGVTFDEEVFNFRRDIPTWRYEAGMICFKGNVTTYRQASEPLEVIYLQDSWSEYNTIHWNGEISSTTYYNVQYRESNEAVWHDVIPENGFYDELHNLWLVSPNQRHCFWHTINQIPFNLEKNYYIQVTQYNISSSGMSFTASSIANTTFQFGEEETNPANIYYVEYKRLSKELYIYFRIDDPNNDEYDVIEVSYSPNGTTFYPIPTSALKGYFNNLTSYKTNQDGGFQQPNEHRIIWDTSSFNLTPGDDYRIRIKVIKSKYISGYSVPILAWRKDPNTFLDENKQKVESIEGVWQYYGYDEENKEVVLLTTPVFVEGTYQELEKKIEAIRRENYPLPEWCNGYYEFQVDESDSSSLPIGTIKESITIDGQEYKYVDWVRIQDEEGYSRNDRLYMLSNEFDSVTDSLFNAKDAISNDIKYTRKLLIDQGYYCNGYKNNNSANGKFAFKVLIYFPDYLDENGKYIKPYNEFFGSVIYEYETIEHDDLIEEPVITTTQIHEYDRTSEVYSRIQLDQTSQFNSQHGRPMRDFIFKDGERIISLAGGEDYLKNNMRIINENHPPETDYQREDVTRYKNVKDNFSIPTEYLPGEQETDITLWEDDNFEGDYYWRVSSYNVIRAPYYEKPFVTNQSFTYEDNNRIFLHLFVKADEDIRTMNIKDIWYFDESDSTYTANDIHEVYFGTDVSDSDIASGDAYDFNWLPMTKDRTRPIVIKDKNHRYNIWYSRSDNYGNKVVIYCKGRSEDVWGDYDTAIPDDGGSFKDNFRDVTDVYSPYVFVNDGTYWMYYTTYSSNGNSIKLGTSTDGNIWNSNTLNGISGSCYNPFARIKDGFIELYYCKYINGLSRVYRSFSSDGITFSGEELFFESENNISSIFMLEHDNSDVIFYSEAYEESDSGTVVNKYRINNNSGGIFPIINNASNFYCYKDGFDYVFYYDFENKIYTGRMRNYIKKSMSSSSYNVYISGLMNNISVNPDGVDVTLVINRNAATGNWWNYVCNSEFRNTSSIKGFIVDCEGSAKYKEYRIESPFLSSANVDETNGQMDPLIYRYMKITKTTS